MSGDGRPNPGAQAEQQLLAKLIDSLPSLTQEVRTAFEERRKLDAEQKKKELEVGWVGRLIGDHVNAPTRIAFVVIALCALILIVVICVSSFRTTESSLLDKIVTGAFALMSGALGYVFGRNANDRAPQRR